jgi:hypothetical protein
MIIASIIASIIAIVAAILLISAFKLQWLFLCRSSLIGLGIMYLLPLLSIMTPLKGLLAGAFDLQNFNAGFTVGLLLFFATWAVTATSDLILDAAATRLNQTLPPLGDYRYLHNVRGLFIVGAVVLNAYAIYFSREETRSITHFSHTLKILAALFLGLLVGLLIFVLIQLLRPKTDPQPFEITNLHGRFLSKQESSLRNLAPANLNPADGFRFQLFGWPILIPTSWGRGYLQVDAAGKVSILQPHIYAVIALSAAGAVYFIVFFWFQNKPLPSLGSLLLLLILGIWFLSALGFFLDAYKIPVFFSIFAIAVVTSRFFPGSDHFYRICIQNLAKAKGASATEPASQVLSWRTDDGKPAVLICAAGGGIQAAAWTARALTGLEEQLDGANPGLFARSIRLLSGVSGGSVGIMFYVHATYPVDRVTNSPADRRQRIVNEAMDSSLDPAVFALTYYDLRRFLFPYFEVATYRDRAQALEEAWASNAEKEFPSTSIPRLNLITLGSWSGDVMSQKRPAVIFNSTVAESGDRMTFATSRLSATYSNQRDFFTLYPDNDIPISTAVRLSATFPVVSPAARPKFAASPDAKDSLPDQTQAEAYHLVDGGYFDNSGLTALSIWLDDALQILYAAKTPPLPYLPKRILVIQILPFPEGSRLPPAQSFSHLLAPLQALFSVRSRVQVGMAGATFASVKKRWELEPYNPKQPRQDQSPIYIELHQVQFRPSSEQKVTPLSWHLCGSEKKQIEDAWTRFKDDREMKEIREFFNNAREN